MPLQWNCGALTTGPLGIPYNTSCELDKLLSIKHFLEKMSVVLYIVIKARTNSTYRFVYGNPNQEVLLLFYTHQSTIVLNSFSSKEPFRNKMPNMQWEFKPTFLRNVMMFSNILCCRWNQET